MYRIVAHAMNKLKLLLFNSAQHFTFTLKNGHQKLQLYHTVSN